MLMDIDWIGDGVFGCTCVGMYVCCMCVFVCVCDEMHLLHVECNHDAYCACQMRTSERGCCVCVCVCELIDIGQIHECLSEKANVNIITCAVGCGGGPS